MANLLKRPQASTSIRALMYPKAQSRIQGRRTIAIGSLGEAGLLPSAVFATHVCRLDGHHQYPDIK
jgi:hypothetical protein